MKISHLQENLTLASAPTASVPGPKFGRSDEMLESGASTTTAGVMATDTPTNMGVQRRSKKGSDLLKGIKTSEKYPNSRKAGISEDAINEDDLSEEQLQAKKRREELFKRSKDRDIGKKPVSREIMAKEQAMEEGDEQIDGMAQGEIREIIKNAIHIKNQLDKGVSLDGWMYSYVTTSNDHLNSVAEQINNPHIDEQGVAEGSEESYIIVRTDSEGKKDVFAGNFDTYEQAQKELDACLAHPLHTKYKQKFEIKRKGQQGVAEEWSKKYKSSINCSHPKGFSQKAHCAGKKKHNESVESQVMEMVCEDCGMCQTHGDNTKDKLDELKCWSGYHRVAGTKAGFPGSCAKNKTNEEIAEEKCPHCSGPMFSEMIMNEKKDACYYKVKSRYKVWPSAYASGALVKCRKKGAGNWGNGGQKSESMTEEELAESLHDWFTKEKWVRMDTKGNIKGPCAREPGEGKPKCLPQSKAHNLGKKGRASAAQRKRREDPNPERSGPAINVNTKKSSNESVTESKERCMQCGMKDCKCPGDSCKCKPIAGWIPNKGFRKAMEEGALRKLTK